MKNLKMLFVIVALTTCQLFAATPTDKVAPKTETAKVISKLLENPDFAVDAEVLATVALTVNKDLEIVVMDVETDDPRVESFIKARLNYQEMKNVKVGEQITVPVRVVAGV